MENSEPERLVYNEIMLVLPTEELREDICAFMEECRNAGEKHIQGSGFLEQYDFDTWLQKMRLLRTLPVTRTTSPADTYLAYRRCDGRLIGCCQFRHSMTEQTEKCGGNIGYEVRPSERGKGYAGQMLTALIRHAARLGMKQLIVDCDEKNITSSKTITGCGGKLLKILQFKNGETEQTVYRYLIHC